MPSRFHRDFLSDDQVLRFQLPVALCLTFSESRGRCSNREFGGKTTGDPYRRRSVFPVENMTLGVNPRLEATGTAVALEPGRQLVFYLLPPSYEGDCSTCGDSESLEISWKTSHRGTSASATRAIPDQQLVRAGFAVTRLPSRDSSIAFCRPRLGIASFLKLQTERRVSSK